MINHNAVRALHGLRLRIAAAIFGGTKMVSSDPQRIPRMAEMSEEISQTVIGAIKTETKKR